MDPFLLFFVVFIAAYSYVFFQHKRVETCYQATFSAGAPVEEGYAGTIDGYTLIGAAAVLDNTDKEKNSSTNELLSALEVTEKLELTETDGKCGNGLVKDGAPENVEETQKPKSSSSKPPRVKKVSNLYPYPVTPTTRKVNVLAPCVVIKEEAKASEEIEGVNKISEDAQLQLSMQLLRRCRTLTDSFPNPKPHGHKINQIKHNTNTQLNEKPKSSSSKPPRVKNSVSRLNFYQYPVTPTTRKVNVHAPCVVIKEEATASEIEAVNKTFEDAQLQLSIQLLRRCRTLLTSETDSFPNPKPHGHKINQIKHSTNTQLNEKPKSSSSKPPRVKNSVSRSNFYQYPTRKVDVHAPCVVIKEEATASEIEAVNKMFEDAKLQFAIHVSQSQEKAEAIEEKVEESETSSEIIKEEEEAIEEKVEESERRSEVIKEEAKTTPEIEIEFVVLKGLESCGWKMRLKSIKAVKKIVEDAKLKDHFELLSKQVLRLVAVAMMDISDDVCKVAEACFGDIVEVCGPEMVLKNVSRIQGPAKEFLLARLMKHGQPHSMPNNPMPAAAAHSLFDFKMRLESIKDHFDWLSKQVAIQLLRPVAVAMMDISADVCEAAEECFGEIVSGPQMVLKITSGVFRTFIRLGHKINQIINQNKHKTNTNLASKELLKVIHKVEKMYQQELNEYKRSPTAKKAEREKRVKTLMSMR